MTSFPTSLLRGGLYLLAVFLLCLSYWLHRSFGQPELDQIAYHLNFGVEMVDSVDPVIVRRFVRWCVLAPLIFLVLLYYAERRWLRMIETAPQRGRVLLYRLHRWFPPLMVMGATMFWVSDVSAFKYVTADFGPDYFGANYVRPETVPLATRQPKNLILIYVESLEQGYSQQAVFDHDLLAPLSRLPGSSFSRYQQVAGTGWTIAGMVATQCGVPLQRVTIFDGNTQGQLMDSFLKNAVCLSDLLAARGYRNVFMGGAATAFAGKGKFLSQHHYHEVYGREDWLQGGVRERDMNGWGLYDADLFARARTKLRALSASGAQFNLTLLTVDTHEPEGHLSPDCARRGFRGFDGVVSCTAQEVAEFVRYARDNGYLEHTSIVILGDHLSRKNPLTPKLARLAERSIFNRFIGTGAPAPNRAGIVHFDMLPTILEFIGYEVPAGRMALGYSGFNAHRLQPPAARLADMKRDLMNRSPTYMALWTDPVAH